MTLLLVWVLRKDVFVLPSTLVLCPNRMMPADFTQGRQNIILTGFIKEKKYHLYFSRPKEIVCPTMMPQGFIQCIVTWISGLGYFGNEHLATFWLQDSLTGKDSVPNKVAGRAQMTAGVHPAQYVLDSQDLLISGESNMLPMKFPCWMGSPTGQN